MNLAGHQFVAGAGLAADDHVRARYGRAAHIVKHAAHRGRRRKNREFELRIHRSWGQRVQQ